MNPCTSWTRNLTDSPNFATESELHTWVQVWTCPHCPSGEEGAPASHHPGRAKLKDLVVDAYPNGWQSLLLRLPLQL
jgi:hypothetical protein